MADTDLLVPDLGNFSEATVIDVLVAVGDQIALEQPLITLETDKASMDFPATAAGEVLALHVARGAKVAAGSRIATLRAANAVAEAVISPAAVAPAVASVESAPNLAATPTLASSAHAAVAVDRRVPVVVLGAGPGGYTAAFRAADLGLQVMLIERWPMLGGVCLNVGCIPSKALLHAAKVIEDAGAMAPHGIQFGAPQIDIAKLRNWKGSVVKKLTNGLNILAKQRKIEVLQGVARFLGPNALAVEHNGKSERIGFEHCVIAAGSESARLPFLPEDPRIIDSTGALELADLPQRMLVLGGGIIGLEMACVYAALGVKVSVVELMPQLMPGCDPDLVRPLEKRIRARYEQILLATKVTAVESLPNGLRVTFEGKSAPEPQVYDKLLVAVGRTPNGRQLDVGAAGVACDDRGFIPVNAQQRSNIAHIFAIGDIAGQPMLAHKATHEAKVAAEVIAGHKALFDARCIPSVAYTAPEMAWVGLTELEPKVRGVDYKKGMFPWAASGRALAQARDEGFTKLLFDPANNRVLGGGIVGPNAGELIAEIGLAIEMGADASDIGLTVHAHPTLSETVAMAAEAFSGTLTDLYMPER